MPTLFGAVVPEQVHSVLIYDLMGHNEHAIIRGRDIARPTAPRYDMTAMARALKTLHADRPLAQSHVQAQTWNFDTMTTRPHSKLIAMMTVIWHDAEYDRARIQNVSAFRVEGLGAGECECIQSEGLAGWPWHWNTWAAQESDVIAIKEAALAAIVEENEWTYNSTGNPKKQSTLSSVLAYLQSLLSSLQSRLS